MHLDYHLTLKSLKLKATPKRLAILEILADEFVYLGPDDVWRRLKDRFKRIGLPTVYRNLEELSEGGVISKVIHPDRKLYYFFCKKQEHHHHFICLSCRKVEDISFCSAREIEKEVAGSIQGKVLSHILQINGLCRSCSGGEER
ncbi:MAG: transcriptional repressor [Nitrospirales bacterium]|nr:transcriptional repressor [Nitrospirales bacterium]